MTLIIESCSERGIVAFAQKNSITSFEEIPFGYHNSKYLMPAIQRIVEKKVPERILVGVGPGSYTGIRVGATAAKALSFAWNIRVQTISTLAAFGTDGVFAVVIDAAISGVYLLTPGGAPRICALDQLENELKGINTIVTPNQNKLRPKLEALFGENKWQWQELYPDPLRMLKVAENTPLLTHDQLELLYLRKTQAEIEKAAGPLL